MSEFYRNNSFHAGSVGHSVRDLNALVCLLIITIGAAVGWIAFESIAASVAGAIAGFAVCLLIEPLRETLTEYMERFCA